MTTAPTEQAESQGLLLRLLDPGNRADPYGLAAQFRDHGPLQLPEARLTVFSTYRDCEEVLRHPSSASDRSKSALAQQQVEAQTQALTEAGVVLPPPVPPGFLFLDPPDHTRMRKLVSKAFAPRVVNALQARYQRAGRRIAGPDRREGPFDVVEDFAYPLPVAVICRLLGVRSKTSRSSITRRRCWHSRWTRSWRLPVRRRTVWRSGCRPD